MKKRILQVACLSLATGLLGLAGGAGASAQALASARMQNSARPAAKPQSLKRVLGELENRYKITFAFDEALLKNREVVPVQASSLEQTLDQILTPLGLRYRRVKETIYIILEADKGAALPSASPETELRPVLAGEQAVARRITGTVTDQNGTGLPGVSVLEEGTTNGTATDSDGRFALNVSDNATRLVFSSIGFQTQTVDITSQTSVTVRLVEDDRTLNEVVVVGYGTQRRGDLTGAIGIVDTKEITKLQTATVSEQLQGRVAGVSIATTGIPGGRADVKIRGIGTFGTSNPLWVIDGLQVDDAGRELNPADIQSIQVLKDASATALYGSRGMNGVIIVTTKKGRSGEPRVDVSTYAGVQSIPRKLPLMNAAQYREANRFAYTNAGLQPQALRQGVDTDWQDVFFKQGLITDNTVSVSGGSPNSSYLLSANYFFQDGTVIGPSFRRYQIRANTEMKRGKFTIGQTLNLSRTNETRLNGNPFIDIIRLLPTIPVEDPSVPGGFGIGDPNNNTFGGNVVGLQRLINNTQVGNRILGTLYGEYRILPYLTYRLQGSLEAFNYFDQEKRRSGRLSQNAPVDPSRLSESRGEVFNPQIENTLTFNKDFGVHHVDALAGYTFYSQKRRFTTAITNGLPGEFWVPRAGTIAPQVGGEEFVSTLISYLGRINYTYREKYLFQFNIRRDGSSNFGKNNKYGNFPSASVGWRISEEPFLKNNTPWINDLKLRASYGTVGNQAIPPYEIQQFINPNVTYVLGADQSIVPGSTSVRLTNPNLRWESKTQFDVGIDAVFLNNRLTLTADYFHARSTDLLTRVPIPLTAGSAGDNPFENIASMQNQGVELALGFNDSRRDGQFSYSLFGTFTAVRNKVLGLVPDNGNQPIFGWGGVTRTAIGRPVGEFFLLRREGIFQTQEEINNSPQKGQATPGDVRWKDVDGNGVFDAQADREYAGSPFPNFEYSLNATANYRGFDLTAYFYGLQGSSIFSPMAFWAARYNDNGNYRTDDPFWTGPGTSNTNPKPVLGDRTTNAVFYSDRWLEPGSYFRLRNLQVGYTLPTALLNRTKAFRSVRVYVAAQNLFTITKYRWYNPEVVGPDSILGRSIDDGSYPGSRVLTGGLQIGF